MKRNKLKTSKTGQSLTMAIMAGVFAASALSILLTALVTNLVLKGSLYEKSVGATIFLIRSISTLVGALIGGTVLKQKFLLQVGLTALGYMAILLGIGIVFYDGSFKHFFSGAVSVLVGALAALMVLLMPKRKSRRSLKFSL